MKTISPKKVEIKVQRPDGSIETMIHPKIDYMTPSILKAMNKAMSAAGRGQVTEYKNIEAVIEMEASDYAGHCDRCHGALDTRSAYSQKEWTRFNGQKTQVIAYYCDSCKTLLRQIGIGERTAMQYRAVDVPSFEPAYKSDL